MTVVRLIYYVFRTAELLYSLDDFITKFQTFLFTT